MERQIIIERVTISALDKYVEVAVRHQLVNEDRTVEDVRTEIAHYDSERQLTAETSSFFGAVAALFGITNMDKAARKEVVKPSPLEPLGNVASDAESVKG